MKHHSLPLVLLLFACAAEDSGSLVDPGKEPWQPVPAAEVAARCQLDRTLLGQADEKLKKPYAVIRHGLLCHEYYPDGQLPGPTAAWSATKTLGAVTLGALAYQLRDVQRTGPRTGPPSDLDRLDYWVGPHSLNKDALLAHVLAMVAHNKSLAPGQKSYSYDVVGSVQINQLSDVMNNALKQDAARERLGGDLEAFSQRFLFAPLGLSDSVWNEGKADKVLGYSWMTTVRDMARVGLLLLHNGRWGGERLLSEDWVYRMSHPAFEDANTAYGYLTWLNASSNHVDGLGGGQQQGPEDPCAPVAVHQKFPHPPSEALDCGYSPPYTCMQPHDVGVFYAAGLGGQYIVVHRGLDLVLVVKDLGVAGSSKDLWAAVRPALVALDPKYRGDEREFCAAYASGSYAPALDAR